jgi:hypothetical protein
MPNQWVWAVQSFLVASSPALPPESLDLASAGLKQTEVTPLAERDELTKVQRLGVAGETPIATQEPGQCHLSRIDQIRVVDDDSGGMERWS